MDMIHTDAEIDDLGQDHDTEQAALLSLMDDRMTAALEVEHGPIEYEALQHEREACKEMPFMTLIRALDPVLRIALDGEAYSAREQHIADAVAAINTGSSYGDGLVEAEVAAEAAREWDARS
jgi:hypothetical protein